MYDIENKASVDHYDDVIIPSRHASNGQTPIFFCVLRPITVEFGIWGHILLLIGHIASKREKTRHGLSNDDVINLKAMIERYTLSSNL